MIILIKHNFDKSLSIIIYNTEKFDESRFCYKPLNFRILNTV